MKVSGQSAKAALKAVKNILEDLDKLPMKKKNYLPEQVFNMGKTSLF